MISQNIEGQFKAYGVLENISKLFSRFKGVYVYEVDKKTGDSYSIYLDPWENIPSLAVDRLKAGSEFLIEPVEKKRNGIGYEIQVKSLKFIIPDSKFHREVTVDGNSAHIFREENRWLIILGSDLENRSEVNKIADKCLDAVHHQKASAAKPRDTSSKPRANASKPARRRESASEFSYSF